jgi:indole-3-pyruvate monooxygenase
VVICTGYSRKPNLPVWPGQEQYQGEILHSSQYRSGEPYRGKQVLVVGFGNSGGEIAIDLHEHGALPAISVRSPLNIIPKEILGIPVLALAIAQRKLPARLSDAINAPVIRLTLGDISKLGLKRAGVGPTVQVQQKARIPVIDVGTLRLIRAGKVQLMPEIERFTPEGVVFSGGSAEIYAVVILATGFRAGIEDYLEGAAQLFNERGDPAPSGCETALPGLFLCGFHVAVTGMLREISIEARQIAEQVAAQPPA